MGLGPQSFHLGSCPAHNQAWSCVGVANLVAGGLHAPGGGWTGGTGAGSIWGVKAPLVLLGPQVRGKGCSHPFDKELAPCPQEMNQDPRLRVLGSSFSYAADSCPVWCLSLHKQWSRSTLLCGSLGEGLGRGVGHQRGCALGLQPEDSPPGPTVRPQPWTQTGALGREGSQDLEAIPQGPPGGASAALLWVGVAGGCPDSVSQPLPWWVAGQVPAGSGRREWQQQEQDPASRDPRRGAVPSPHGPGPRGPPALPWLLSSAVGRAGALSSASSRTREVPTPSLASALTDTSRSSAAHTVVVISGHPRGQQPGQPTKPPLPSTGAGLDGDGPAPTAAAVGPAPSSWPGWWAAPPQPLPRTAHHPPLPLK